VTTSLGTEPLPQAPAPLFRMAFARSFFVEEAAPPEAPVSLSAAAVEDSVTVPEGQRARFTLSATLTEPSQGETTLVTNWVYPNDELGVITIGDGETSGSIEIEIFNANDVYLDGFTQTITVTSASGGNFEFIDLSSGSASTTITITDSLVPVIVRLTATESVTEGGSIVYTATLENNASLPDLVTDSPLVITLDNGTTITIPVGFDSASSEPVPVRADDLYVQGTDTVIATITGTTGGDFERLDYSTFGTASTLVNDDSDTTTVTLESVILDGSGNYTVTASIDNAPQNTQLVLRLSNGASLTFGVGQITAESTAVAIQTLTADNGSLAISVVASDGGGNFEDLQTVGTVTVPTLITADGLRAEYYGYNDAIAFDGQSLRAVYQSHSDDRKYGNLDSVKDVEQIISKRSISGNSLKVDDAQPDATFLAKEIDFGILDSVKRPVFYYENTGRMKDNDVSVRTSLGTNTTNFSPGSTITSGNLHKFVGDSGTDLQALEGGLLGPGADSGLGRTTDAAIRFAGKAYFEAGLYDIRIYADDGFQLKLNGEIVAVLNGIQQPTARIFEGVAVDGGLTGVELLYWDQAQNAVLLVEFKIHGSDESAYKVLGSSGGIPLFSDAGLQLNPLQDLISDTAPGTYLVRTGLELDGDDTANSLTGTEARDALMGLGGDDNLSGGDGNDRIDGGQGDDILTGGTGRDVFAWTFGDEGSTQAPAHDVISDFDNTSYAGDVLDLRDLLIGETHAANTTTLPDPIGLTNALTITSYEGNLGNYLSFSTATNQESGEKDTVIEISSRENGPVDQVITLAGVDLVGERTNNQVIADLLARGKLITDVA